MSLNAWLSCIVKKKTSGNQTFSRCSSSYKRNSKQCDSDTREEVIKKTVIDQESLKKKKQQQGKI